MTGKKPRHRDDGESVAPLLLLGAGDRARAALALVRERPAWIPVGVLDDDPELHGQDVDGVPVLGAVDLVYALPEAALLACDPSLRERVVLPAERWVTLR